VLLTLVFAAWNAANVAAEKIADDPKRLGQWIVGWRMCQPTLENMSTPELPANRCADVARHLSTSEAVVRELFDYLVLEGEDDPLYALQVCIMVAKDKGTDPMDEARKLVA